MIRKTLSATQLATYSIDLPDERSGMPRPTGTGFFVSPDGWFVTAAHVVTKNTMPDGPPRDDIENCWLMKERRPGKFMSGMCQYARLELILPHVDFALLKLDFARNADKEHLKGRNGFYHLVVSTRELEEGEPVYAFDYPLADFGILVSDATMTIGHAGHRPRTTSAIVAANMDVTQMVTSSADPKVYVLDKALNYGNSGGPIVATDTGKVHALCSRFQPLMIPQPHIKTADGKYLHLSIPSLYGVVSSLHNHEILSCLRQRGVSLSDD
jgi:serine protease Do